MFASSVATSWHPVHASGPGVFHDTVCAGEPSGLWQPTAQVVGVVPDFTLGSVRQQIPPTMYAIIRNAPPDSVAMVVKLDGQTVVDYTLPKGSDSQYELPTKNTYLPHGTFALQGHDPGSKVYFKNIRVKVLPD